jgi:hypothetical protein
MRVMPWIRWSWPPLLFDAIVYVAVLLTLLLVAGIWRALMW